MFRIATEKVISGYYELEVTMIKIWNVLLKGRLVSGCFQWIVFFLVLIHRLFFAFSWTFILQVHRQSCFYSWPTFLYRLNLDLVRSKTLPLDSKLDSKLEEHKSSPDIRTPPHWSDQMWIPPG